MRTSGIYQIQNVVNGKKYIGSAVDLKNRESGHWSALSKNKHKNARKEISAQYGTCISNISFIKNKRNWGHL